MYECLIRTFAFNSLCIRKRRRKEVGEPLGDHFGGHWGGHYGAIRGGADFVYSQHSSQKLCSLCFRMYVVNVERSLNRFTIEIFLSLFEFLGGLFNFPSCRVGAYSRVGAYFIATILQVINYSNFCIWCKEM